MKNIALEKLSITHEGDLTFDSADKWVDTSGVASGWYIAYAKIDDLIYNDTYKLEYQFQKYTGNLLILWNDNYQDDLEVLMIESTNISIMWRYKGERHFNKKILELDSNLIIISHGKFFDYENNLLLEYENYIPRGTKFYSIPHLICELEEKFFFDNFIGY